MGKITKYSLINSIGTSAYIVAISYFMFFIPKIFEAKENVLSSVFMIMLFVFSAAFTGSLVFGRPIMWYIDGKKKEALALLFRTLLMFFVLMAIVFILIFSFL